MARLLNDGACVESIAVNYCIFTPFIKMFLLSPAVINSYYQTISRVALCLSVTN